MTEWALREKNLKKYPHFDGWISLKEATSYVTNSDSVTTHKFYPFLLFKKRWNRFAKKGSHGKAKERPIRFAARLDAYIFSYYRHILSEAYEKKIFGTGVSKSVLAYRRLKDEATGGGKCNIHFARDAFNAIRGLGDCHVIALDISSFFENLDHEYLKNIWCNLIGVNRLPDDHYQVFKAITQYSIVDKTEVYERLGYFGVKSSTPSGNPIKGYLKNYEDMPKQLCTGKTFREKIAGGDGNKSLVRKNPKPWGIPQGAPISDLLANIYLIEFDMILAERAKLLGGFYLRYSDDILLILPVDEKSTRDFMQQVCDLLPQFGKKLLIKQEKTSLSRFVRVGNEQQYELLSDQKQGRNGLEYLGFRYNGKKFILGIVLSHLFIEKLRA